MSKTTTAAKKSTKAAAPKAPKTVGRPPAADRVEQNGVTQPKEGTDCRKVWDLADKLGQDRAAVLEAAIKAGVNPATSSTQYARWRQFNGIVGRTAKPAAPKAPKASKKDAGAKAEAAVKASKPAKAPAAPKAPTAPAAPVAPAAPAA